MRAAEIVGEGIGQSLGLAGAAALYAFLGWAGVLGLVALILAGTAFRAVRASRQAEELNCACCGKLLHKCECEGGPFELRAL